MKPTMFHSPVEPHCGSTTLLLTLPLGQIHAERLFHWFIRSQQMVINHHLARLRTELLAEILEILQILLAEAVRIDQEFMSRHLQVAELRPFLEWELDLLRSKDVEEQYLMALVPKMAQRLHQWVDGLKAIR
jgi:hypothetical protein